MRWIMDLQDISMLPCDVYDEEYEAWKKRRIQSAASYERLFEKRQRAKEQYIESLDRITVDYRGGDFDIACLRPLKLEKYGEQLRDPHRESRYSDKFPCILHGGKGPWAHLFWGNSGDLLYKCPHEGHYRLTLPQVRASLAYKPVKGKAVHILHDHNAEHMVWRLRLLWEAGVIETLHVPHKLRPAHMREGVSRVYFGLLRLLALKWNVPEWDGNGTTLSLDFGAAWTELTKNKVRGAMKWLLKNGYVKEVGQLKASFGTKLGIYLPG
jgi:hypothetical protein